ncbi:hypothetical protein FHX37_3757 [Haloactinospora alba]|uniref:Uncharacterized protein n=1 Tax=Haloactinospora alba TaxID=405555 RepID=A0A543N998_9ACTN|nr:hypothetical protein FHX37_3757 [Haloactinospora alba]
MAEFGRTTPHVHHRSRHAAEHEPVTCIFLCQETIGHGNRACAFPPNILAPAATHRLGFSHPLEHNRKGEGQCLA